MGVGTLCTDGRGLGLVLVFLFRVCLGAEFDLTIEVPAGRAHCYFQPIDNPKHAVIEIDYQVIDGGDLDISFYAKGPAGQILVTDIQKMDANHRLDIRGQLGDYEFCFDNSYSYQSGKTIFFELLIEDEQGNTDELEYAKMAEEKIAEEAVQSLENVRVTAIRLKSSLNRAEHYQSLLRAAEARDRAVMEGNFDRVNLWSLLHLTAMICVSLIQFVDAVKEGRVNSSDWSSQQLHPKTVDKQAVDWVFVVDTINFSFWTPPESKFEVTYKDKKWTGYFGGCACVNRALDEGTPITDPHFYSQLTDDHVSSIFRGDHDIPMPLLNRRKAVLHEVGTILLEKFNGSFYSVVEKANNSAKKLLQLIVENFPCFRDEATYKGQKVTFWKRAQILVADVWRALKGEGVGLFPDIDYLTIFADYRVPQVLAYVGVLGYGEELRRRLEAGSVFECGEEMEVELRGCTIHACELILGLVRDMLLHEKESLGLYAQVNSVVVDNFFWCHRRAHADAVEEAIPFHRVRTIFY